MTDKAYCLGSGTSNFTTRPYPFPNVRGDGPLARCNHCKRVLRPTPKGVLRQHQVRGRTTASMDKTMETLWEAAGEKRVALTIPTEYNPTHYIAIQVDTESEWALAKGKPQYSAVIVGPDGRQLVELGDYEGALGALLKDAGQVIRSEAGRA